MGPAKPRPGSGKAEVLRAGGGGIQQGIHQRLQVGRVLLLYSLLLCGTVLSCSTFFHYSMMSVCCAGSGFALRHVVTGLDAHFMYAYRLRASNDVGGSAWSPVVKVTTTGTLKECMLHQFMSWHYWFSIPLISADCLCLLLTANIHTCTCVLYACIHMATRRSTCDIPYTAQGPGARQSG